LSSHLPGTHESLAEHVGENRGVASGHARLGRHAISGTGLRKAYGEHLVLDGIDLQVRPGTVFALLGPNCAGKTTVVRIMSTLTGADAGRVEVVGRDVAAEADAVHAVLRCGQPAHRRGEPAADG